MTDALRRWPTPALLEAVGSHEAAGEQLVTRVSRTRRRTTRHPEAFHAS